MAAKQSFHVIQAPLRLVLFLLLHVSLVPYTSGLSMLSPGTFYWPTQQFNEDRRTHSQVSSTLLKLQRQSDVGPPNVDDATAVLSEIPTSSSIMNSEHRLPPKTVGYTMDFYESNDGDPAIKSFSDSDSTYAQGSDEKMALNKYLDLIDIFSSKGFKKQTFGPGQPKSRMFNIGDKVPFSETLAEIDRFHTAIKNNMASFDKSLLRYAEDIPDEDGMFSEYKVASNFDETKKISDRLKAADEFDPWRGKRSFVNDDAKMTSISGGLVNDLPNEKPLLADITNILKNFEKQFKLNSKSDPLALSGNGKADISENYPKREQKGLPENFNILKYPKHPKEVSLSTLTSVDNHFVSAPMDKSFQSSNKYATTPWLYFGRFKLWYPLEDRASSPWSAQNNKKMKQLSHPSENDHFDGKFGIEKKAEQEDGKQKGMTVLIGQYIPARRRKRSVSSSSEAMTDKQSEMRTVRRLSNPSPSSWQTKTVSEEVKKLNSFFDLASEKDFPYGHNDKTMEDVPSKDTANVRLFAPKSESQSHKDKLLQAEKSSDNNVKLGDSTSKLGILSTNIHSFWKKYHFSTDNTGSLAQDKLDMKDDFYTKPKGEKRLKFGINADSLMLFQAPRLLKELHYAKTWLQNLLATHNVKDGGDYEPLHYRELRNGTAWLEETLTKINSQFRPRTHTSVTDHKQTQAEGRRMTAPVSLKIKEGDAQKEVDPPNENLSKYEDDVTSLHNPLTLSKSAKSSARPVDISPSKVDQKVRAYSEDYLRVKRSEILLKERYNNPHHSKQTNRNGAHDKPHPKLYLTMSDLTDAANDAANSTSEYYKVLIPSGLAAFNHEMAVYRSNVELEKAFSTAMKQMVARARARSMNKQRTAYRYGFDSQGIERFRKPSSPSQYQPVSSSQVLKPVGVAAHSQYGSKKSEGAYIWHEHPVPGLPSQSNDKTDIKEKPHRQVWSSPAAVNIDHTIDRVAVALEESGDASRDDESVRNQVSDDKELSKDHKSRFEDSSRVKGEAMSATDDHKIEKRSTSEKQGRQRLSKRSRIYWFYYPWIYRGYHLPREYRTRFVSTAERGNRIVSAIEKRSKYADKDPSVVPPGATKGESNFESTPLKFRGYENHDFQTSSGNARDVMKEAKEQSHKEEDNLKDLHNILKRCKFIFTHAKNNHDSRGKRLIHTVLKMIQTAKAVRQHQAAIKRKPHITEEDKVVLSILNNLQTNMHDFMLGMTTTVAHNHFALKYISFMKRLIATASKDETGAQHTDRLQDAEITEDSTRYSDELVSRGKRWTRERKLSGIGSNYLGFTTPGLNIGNDLSASVIGYGGFKQYFQPGPRAHFKIRKPLHQTYFKLFKPKSQRDTLTKTSDAKGTQLPDLSFFLDNILKAQESLLRKSKAIKASHVSEKAEHPRSKSNAHEINQNNGSVGFDVEGKISNVPDPETGIILSAPAPDPDSNGKATLLEEIKTASNARIKRAASFGAFRHHPNALLWNENTNSGLNNYDPDDEMTKLSIIPKLTTKNMYNQENDLPMWTPAVGDRLYRQSVDRNKIVSNPLKFGQSGKTYRHLLHKNLMYTVAGHSPYTTSPKDNGYNFPSSIPPKSSGTSRRHNRTNAISSSQVTNQSSSKINFESQHHTGPVFTQFPLPSNYQFKPFVVRGNWLAALTTVEPIGFKDF